MRASSGDYTPDWPEIARSVKDAADWRCVRCRHPHEVETGYVLTVHHLDMDKGNNRWWNLLALCQRCHLSIQARVDLRRPWVLAEHSVWFRLYVAGWYAWRYLGEDVTREEAEQRLDELLALERQAVLGGAA